MFEFNKTFAAQCDLQDPLKEFRANFLIPQHQGKPVMYFTGNSLGLQCTGVKEAIIQELDDWAKYGVEGHFMARRPWLKYHEFLTKGLAKIVGAKETEVVAMNGLTTNIHLLMATFYRPTATKYKILTEAKAFPSDQYAIQSQLNLHGYKDGLIEISPRAGSHLIDEDDILSAMERHQHELALVFIGGVNYYTGQKFDMQKIAAKARSLGICCGFDLAHAAGNVELKLHDWGVDFAAWCSYKYLNAGPGSVSGVFIHERHALNTALPRWAGWWGHDKTTRFEMGPIFNPIPTAEGWQLSNAPVFAMAPLIASLELFNKAGFDTLRKKSTELTAFLEFVINHVGGMHNADFEVITPKNPNQRGAQLSILCHGFGKKLFDRLTSRGVIADWREPNVIRMAPVPLYNSFADVFEFGEVLNEVLHEKF